MKSDKNYSLYFAVFAFGLASMVGQILILRELIVVFHGNELSVGIMLASWLFWVAIGSWGINNISHFIEKRFKLYNAPYLLFPSLIIAISIMLPLSIFLVRNIKNILNVSAGEIIGLIPISISSFLVLAPICLLFGFLFALSCRLACRESKEESIEVGRIYILEAIGACVGGLAFNYILIHIFKTLQIALFCIALNIFATLFLIDVKKRPLRWWTALSFILFILIYLPYGANSLDFRMRQIQWRNFKLMDIEDSIYGNIAITKLDSQLNLFENGLLVSSTQDPLTAEEAVHYALLEHPNPKRVLLIGGSLNGSLDEALKHPVEKIDYVELDPTIIRMAKVDYPSELVKALDDPRVAIHHIDGRLFVKKMSAVKNVEYDVVILILPNPFSAQLNRFYSHEFYREVKMILKGDGIFSFGVTSSENYISPELAQFLGCLHRTLESQFEDVIVFPGDYNFYLASPTKGILTYEPKTLLERLRVRNLDLKYVREYYLPYKLNSQRVEYLVNSIKNASGTKINYDFKPIGYFYNMVLWSTHFRAGTKEAFKKLEALNPKAIALVLYLLFVVLLLFQASSQVFKNFPIKLSIGTTGFSEMVFQIVVILSFQIIYGYVYYKIGLIFASFMLGLVLGSMLAIRILAKQINPAPVRRGRINLPRTFLLQGILRSKKERDLSKIYMATQLAICIYPILLPPIFLFLQLPSRTNFTRSFFAETTFSFLPIIAGFIGGLQFPLANKICLGRGGYIGKVAGHLYGVDLLGACLGALLTSAVLIPIIGINNTCYLTSLMNALVLLLLVVSYLRWGRKR